MDTCTDKHASPADEYPGPTDEYPRAANEHPRAANRHTDPADGNACAANAYSGAADAYSGSADGDSGSADGDSGSTNKHPGAADQHASAADVDASAAHEHAATDQYAAADEYSNADQHAGAGSPSSDGGALAAAAGGVTLHTEESAASSERKTIAFEQHDARLTEGATGNEPVLPPQRDVVIVEVGPRDGLQNETSSIPTSVKIAFVNALADAGLPAIEVTSFVNPKAVPQLADAAEVMTGIDRDRCTRYSVLVPNQRGLERAVEAGADAIALFTSATDAFAQANVGASIDGTFERFEPVVATARRQGIWVRGYVSVSFGCPYSGAVDVAAVIRVAERLLQLGCDQICLADTIGTATPELVKVALQAARPSIPIDQLALHFHDTSGTALANVEQALDLGVRIFDAAAGGLGGCPFAPGAPGNLSTERLIERMAAFGLRTGVDSNAMTAALDVVRPHVPRLARLAA